MSRNVRLLIIVAIAIAASPLLPTAAPSAIAQITVEFDDFNATVEPESAVRQVGQTHTITITVTSDTFRATNVGPQQTTQLIATRPGSGVRVNFFITGANPRSGRTEPTDSSGKTTLSYRGTNSGRDFIQLTILSDDGIDFFTEEGDVTVDWQIPFVKISGPQPQQGVPAAVSNLKPKARTASALQFASGIVGLTPGLGEVSGPLLGAALCFAADQVEPERPIPGVLVCAAGAAAPRFIPGGAKVLAVVDLAKATKNLKIALDPPDPNFKDIARPTPLSITRVSSGPNGSQAVVNAINALAENGARQVGLLGALLTSIERAQGAAAAGNAEFVAKQNQAAADYAAQLVPLLQAEPRLRANLVNALRQAGVSVVTLTPGDVRAVQNSVAANGLPPQVVEALTQAGADDSFLSQARQLFTSLDPDNLPSVTATLQQQAQALSALARALPSTPGSDAEDDDDDDKKRPLTEEQKQQRERTNTGGLDDTRTEGNVVGVRCDLNAAVPSAITGPVSFNPEAVPYALMATRDGMQQVRLLYDTKTQCGSMRVGDYLEADGEKQHEFLFEAHNVTITRGGTRVR